MNPSDTGCRMPDGRYLLKKADLLSDIRHPTSFENAGCFSSPILPSRISNIQYPISNKHEVLMEWYLMALQKFAQFDGAFAAQRILDVRADQLSDLRRPQHF